MSILLILISSRHQATNIDVKSKPIQLVSLPSSIMIWVTVFPRSQSYRRQ